MRTTRATKREGQGVDSQTPSGGHSQDQGKPTKAFPMWRPIGVELPLPDPEMVGPVEKKS